MEAGVRTARASWSRRTWRASRRSIGRAALRSVIEMNPDALTIADALDAERQAQRAARAAARHPGADQGQHRHRRPHARPPPGRWRWRARSPPQRRVRRRAAARGGRGHPRQDEPERVGQLPLARVDRAAGAAAAARRESLRARPQPVRVELGLRRGDRREPLRRGASARRPTARSCARRRRTALVGHQADGRPGEPHGHHPDRAHARTPRGRWRARCRRRGRCSARWPAPTRATTPTTRTAAQASRATTRRLDRGRAARARASASRASYTGYSDAVGRALSRRRSRR